MSIWATAWAYEQTVKPVGRKFILVAIADFADEDGYCFPSQETLATMTDQGVSTVREHLKALETERLIRREHRYLKDGGGRTSDGFFLQAPAERLKPKSKPPKAGGKVRAYRQDSAKHTAESTPTIPLNSGGDPSVTTNTDPLKILRAPRDNKIQSWIPYLMEKKKRGQDVTAEIESIDNVSLRQTLLEWAA